MKSWIAMGCATMVACQIALCGAPSRAEANNKCAVPDYLLLGDSLLPRVSETVRKDKTLRIVVLGGTSSTLPGPHGAAYAYPARLEAALRHRLPQLAVSVVPYVKPRQSAASAAENIAKLLLDQKPALVVWQTGTYDAVRGTDPAEFRETLARGIEALQAGGADVVLMNMQYSPRTEGIVAIGAYADSMRWVAREREVPLFDRLAIMRHWYEAGEFDLYAATKDMATAKGVHECIGRALATFIIDAGRLQVHAEPPAQ